MFKNILLLLFAALTIKPELLHMLASILPLNYSPSSFLDIKTVRFLNRCLGLSALPVRAMIQVRHLYYVLVFLGNFLSSVPCSDFLTGQTDPT